MITYEPPVTLSEDEKAQIRAHLKAALANLDYALHYAANDSYIGSQIINAKLEIKEIL